MIDFHQAFQALTGNPPFPWQQALYDEWFSKGKIPPSCNLPTGLGKTSVIAVWLIALAKHPDKMPRRLVYVVNRRTVVDQTTDEVEKYRKQIDEHPDLAGLKARFGRLPVSTLRGQFADNREWSADPSRPAVICGTVDMIGSRLLFSGYGVGWKSKPLHAGFLGQDALLVHDEAHLEPAFQDLLLAIENEQKREREGKPAFPWPHLRAMELTATPRGGGEVFELTPEEKKAPEKLPDRPETEEAKKNTPPIHHVWWRTHSKKSLVLHEIGDEKKELVPTVVKLALRHLDDATKPAILVFVRTVDAVNEVVAALKKGGVGKDDIDTLTGTMRGYERDRMATESKVFGRFKKHVPVGERAGTVYLVCTSAGEVGVDMSADHMVCDLSTYDSMAQRFGRVNRYGFGDATIDVVHPKVFDTKDKPFEAARERTLGLLKRLRVLGEKLIDASPAALGELIERAIRESGIPDRTQALREYVLSAFAPPPVVLPATDILFDAWALTTIRDKLPGRPPVEPYLHGLPTDWQPPETHVAWREEVQQLNRTPWAEWGQKEFAKFATDLLDEYPLKPHELLKDQSRRVFDRLKKLAAPPDTPVWLQSDDGAVRPTTLGDVIEGDADDLNYLTVILPPTAGGLNSQGMLDEKATQRVDDVADEWYSDKERTHRQRIRLDSDDGEFDQKTEGMHPVFRIDFAPSDGDEEDEEKVRLWFVKANQGDKSAKKPVRWEVHVKDVEDRTAEIVDSLPLGDLREAVKLAAKYHDHGKKRKVFQAVLGNTDPKVWLAKSGKKGGRVKEQYRHEFGSLLDVAKEPDFQALTDDQKELVLHLIAAHHGRACPHFPPDEAFDPERPQQLADEMAAKVPQRFARLQRKYGRWGLAYLESLLRAADWAASANPSKFVEGGQ